MDADTNGTRLTIFLTEDDRVDHHPVYEVLVQRARERGMAGATVCRAVEGYGRSRRIRTLRFPDAFAIREPVRLRRPPAVGAE